MKVISADLGALFGDHRLLISRVSSDFMMTPQKARNPLACCSCVGLRGFA